MIIWVLLIIFLVIRLLVRLFYFSFLSLIILLAYIITLITVLGKVKWSLFWVLGVSIGSILFYFIFNEGIIYNLILDCVLLILGVLGFFIEKKLS
jgi:hypothetical protein